MGAREFALSLPTLVIAELEQGPPPSSPSELMERTRQIVARLAQENGVRGFSADQLSTVARAVGSTMQQVNSQYLPGVIAAEQETRVEAHQQDFNSAWELDQANGVGSANIQSSYAALAAGFYNSGKYDTQGQANEAALQYMMTYLSNSKDIDGLEAMKGVLTNGQKGTEAWKKYGAQIDQAISAVRSGRKADQAASYEQLQDTMYERLAGAQGPLSVKQSSLRLLLAYVPKVFTRKLVPSKKRWMSCVYLVLKVSTLIRPKRPSSVARLLTNRPSMTCSLVELLMSVVMRLSPLSWLVATTATPQMTPASLASRTLLQDA